MTTQTINLKTIEETTSKKTDKKYWKVEDRDGNKYSCFEEDVIEKLKPLLGKDVNVDIVESGNFKNLRGFEGLATPEPEAVTEDKPIRKSRATPERTACMLVEITKDLCVRAEGPVNIMDVTKEVLESYQYFIQNV